MRPLFPKRATAMDGQSGVQRGRWFLTNRDVVMTATTFEPMDAGRVDLMQRCMECFRGDVRSSILLHPELIGVPLGGVPRVPVVVGKWNGTPGQGELEAYACLRPKQVKLRIIPGLGTTASLAGHSLIGSQVVGAQSAEAMEGIVESLGDFLRGGQSPCILFEDVEMESPLARAIGMQAGRRVTVHRMGVPQARWWIDLKGGYWDKFSKKSRGNLRRAAKYFANRVTCYRRPEEMGRFLEAAHAVSLNSWQTKKLCLRVKNNATELRHLELAARLGGVRCYTLHHEEKPVAFVIGYLWNGCYLYEEVGFDGEYAGKSPGSALLYLMLEELIADPAAEVLDFGFGDGEYKRVFGNRQTRSCALLMVEGAALNRAKIFLNWGHNVVARTAREAVGRWAAYRRQRQVQRAT